MAAAPVRFGSHGFDPATGALRRGNAACDLQSQPAQLLGLLLEHAGELVTREQIRLALWPDTVVAYDQNINFAVRRIRVALGEDASLVQTVPRRGYRFVGNVVRETWQADKIAGSRDGRIAGSRDGRIAGSRDGRIAGSRDGRIAGSRDGRIGRGMAVAAAIAVALVSGFGAGILVRDAPAGRFVYDHLVHPDRCPYLRVFVRNS
jgi:DNA-binding winged helix-turn-helix (wHTH) protein